MGASYTPGKEIRKGDRDKKVGLAGDPSLTCRRPVGLRWAQCEKGRGRNKRTIDDVLRRNEGLVEYSRAFRVNDRSRDSKRYRV